MRGQAFIVFREFEHATKAMSDLQGKAFFSKPLVNFLITSQEVALAKQESDRTKIEKGTWNDKIRQEKRVKRKTKLGKIFNAKNRNLRV